MSETMPNALEGGFDPRSDVFNRLLKNRVVLLGTDVNDEVANALCAGRGWAAYGPVKLWASLS